MDDFVKSPEARRARIDKLTVTLHVSQACPEPVEGPQWLRGRAKANSEIPRFARNRLRMMRNAAGACPCGGRGTFYEFVTL